MRLLLISSRMPTPTGKGDQLRAFQFAEALADDYEVQVITTGAGSWNAQDRARLERFASVAVHRTPRPARVVGVLGALLRGQPAQVGWMMPQAAWRTVARRSASGDVALAITVRSVRGGLPCPIALDHVDALSVNMRRRAHGPEAPPLRLLAMIEASLLERWERRLARTVSTQLVISPVDARRLPSPPAISVVPNSVQLVRAEPASGGRDIDVILTGNMSYPPNGDAARWLSEEIAPELWRLRPDTTIWVVGRNADGLRLDSRIKILSDVPDLMPVLARAKVALAPLRIGTGSPNKVLEAMAAGAAIVATPAAVESFDFPATSVSTADTGPRLAAAAAALLDADLHRLEVTHHATASVAAFGTDAQRGLLKDVLTRTVRSRHSVDVEP